MTDYTERYILCYYEGASEMSMKADIFGHMVRLAARRLKAYHSDLYIDAEYIKGLELPATYDDVVTIEYTVRDNGTHLSHIKDDIYPDCDIYTLKVSKYEKVPGKTHLDQMVLDVTHHDVGD